MKDFFKDIFFVQLTCDAELLLICPLTPHICWNWTLISLKVSVMTAINTFFTNQAKKNIIVLK